MLSPAAGTDNPGGVGLVVGEPRSALRAASARSR